MQTTERIYTASEYLALEETAAFRSEYWHGVVVPMTGGSIDHNRILRNLLTCLTLALRGSELEPFSSDLRLWIPAYQLFTYPDVMVLRGEPIFYNNRTDTVMNPILIVEVLSKSTQDYDRTDKFRCYRSLPGLLEYVLISQYEMAIEQFTKTPDGLWLLRDYQDARSEVLLRSIEVAVQVADLYTGVSFASGR
jgi:Uma2 family endonuclease